MEAEVLLRDCMKVKPASTRASRTKSSSTPKGIIRMLYNENNFGMAPSALKVLKETIAMSSRYPDFFAVSLKETIASHYNLKFENIITAPGSSAIIDMLGAIFINPGDEVVYGDPTFGAFPDMANDNGGICVPVPLNDKYEFDLDAIYAKVTDKTKIVVICNPNNPTGTAVDCRKLEELIHKMPSHVITVVDEAYMEYANDPNVYSMIKLFQEGKVDKPLVILKTFSKIYGMAGVRVGYAISNPELTDQLYKSSHAWNVSYSGNLAASAALLYDDEYIKETRKKCILERDYIQDHLSALGCMVVPSQTSFIYFDSHMTPKELSDQLAKRNILIGGSYNGKSRVSIGNHQENLLFIKAMTEILAK
ncbi:histidinol-phosphate aminotransferase [Lachnospiraceae bacterium KM106-2]|nr:histidinol-phosphate aminotransferase [Lachnospiraceae bacterium KM106-2]